jgi:hypothetical protein
MIEDLDRTRIHADVLTMEEDEEPTEYRHDWARTQSASRVATDTARPALRPRQGLHTPTQLSVPPGSSWQFALIVAWKWKPLE